MIWLDYLFWVQWRFAVQHVTVKKTVYAHNECTFTVLWVPPLPGGWFCDCLQSMFQSNPPDIGPAVPVHWWFAICCSLHFKLIAGPFFYVQFSFVHRADKHYIKLICSCIVYQFYKVLIGFNLLVRNKLCHYQGWSVVHYVFSELVDVETTVGFCDWLLSQHSPCLFVVWLIKIGSEIKSLLKIDCDLTWAWMLQPWMWSLLGSRASCVHSSCVTTSTSHFYYGVTLWNSVVL